MSNHDQMFTRIPPNCSMASLENYIKGKYVISIAGRFNGRFRNFGGRTSRIEGALFLRLDWTRRGFEPTSGTKIRQTIITTN